MAAALWGNVNYQKSYAGRLQQEPGGRYRFTYDAAYLEDGGPAIAHTLPLRQEPHLSVGRLHPFFDNLVAEGWLREAQARALGVPPSDRLALLLAFGEDCAGAVSVDDPAPIREVRIDLGDEREIAALAGRASLSGVQPKVLVVRDASGFRPARRHESSTHIAKLPSGSLPDIVPLEWISTAAYRALLPAEDLPEMELAALGNIAPEALIIGRFDRMPSGRKRHFEEFNQLLGKPSEDKYEGAYEDMGRFIRETPGCVPAEAERLLRRVLACILIGNTDAHLKNFAMFHTAEGLRLAPAYDLVASAVYEQYQTLALSLAGAPGLRLGDVQSKHVVALGEAYGLAHAAIGLAVADLGERLEAAKAAAHDAARRHAGLGDNLIEMMERRWNGTFASIGQLLSKRQSAAAGGRGSRRSGSRRSPR